ncbi:MAG: phospholipase C, phosphocholine-specific [Pirellulales bacterium]|nr:phospholipase C, phosphocholine-specific [Pirellulales bacterium]
MDTRRQFLTKAAFLSGAASFSANLFGTLERALAIEPDKETTFWDAEHVVILMQENRSFDHAFGSLRGVRGFNDPRAIRLPNGNPVWVQTNSAGESYLPFRMDIRNSNATWLGCLPHGWTDQVDARNEGRYDRWLDVKLPGREDCKQMPLTMGYHNRDDIPFYYALADAFTICDQHYCSSLTGTTPNRCYLWSGTIRAKQDPHSPAHLLNENADHATNVCWPTFPERLEDFGVSWKVYQNEINVGVGLTADEDAWLSNFGDNPLEYFTQYNVRLTPAYRNYLEATHAWLTRELAALAKQLTTLGNAGGKQAEALNQEIHEKQKQLDEINTQRRKWNQANYDRLSTREKNLLAKAFSSNEGDPDYRTLEEVVYRDGDQQRRLNAPKGDLLHQFRRDVESGKLPAVSWVVAPERFSDHPGSAWFGAWYVAETLDILTQNPAIWKKTIFILTYDENDGYFDHVPPFVAPDPRRPATGKVSASIDAALDYVTRDDEITRKPADQTRDSSIGLGYRVPMIIASPWSRGGFVCSQVFDHTSSLQFLEKWLSKKLGRQLLEPNISSWRRTVCGDLTSTFQQAVAEPATRLPFPTRDQFIEQIDRARFKPFPDGYQRLSAQEIAITSKDPNSCHLMPRQEPGLRPSRALPYDLAASGALSSDRQRFQISLEARNDRLGPQAVGSPFVVYARFKKGDLRTRDYAVAAGNRLVDDWLLADFAEKRYDLALHGPNGFFRHFQGTEDDPLLALTLELARSTPSTGPRSMANLRVRNLGSSESAISLTDLSYGRGKLATTVSAGAEISLSFSCEASYGWYDFLIQVVGKPAFAHRYAGRIESDLPTFSDPAMSGDPNG